MKIINNTRFNYKQIGTLIDEAINMTMGDTFYYGKISVCKAIINNVEIQITIRYLKTYVEWRFNEI